jgi:hypothetical protein
MPSSPAPTVPPPEDMLGLGNHSAPLCDRAPCGCSGLGEGGRGRGSHGGRCRWGGTPAQGERTCTHTHSHAQSARGVRMKHRLASAARKKSLHSRPLTSHTRTLQLALTLTHTNPYRHSLTQTLMRQHTCCPATWGGRRARRRARSTRWCRRLRGPPLPPGRDPAPRRPPTPGRDAAPNGGRACVAP